MPRFDTAAFESERARRGVSLGNPLEFRGETGSTNDDAALGAKAGAPHGALYVADAQTRGRGRRGSEWLSAPGEGLWLSLVLRPTFAAELAPAIALSTGLSVRAAVAARVAAPVTVKWPNDVLAGGRKLAGILVESQLSGARISSVVIGIGINVAQTDFPEPIGALATSLALLGGSDTSREQLLVDVLAQLETELSRLASQGTAGVAQALAPHDALLGRQLRIDGREGRGAGIDPSGQLTLQLADGSRVLIASGHVELLSA